MTTFELMKEISECTGLIDAIERVEFRLIALRLDGDRAHTRIVKRHIILRQTELWHQMDTRNNIPEKKKRKKK